MRDSGTGIPADEIPQLFERFHRVKGARGRSYEGSGIGLALVQELVKLHGGNVRVESEVGRGSSFVVTIPFGKDHLPYDRIGRARTMASTSVSGDAYVQEALRWLPKQKDIALGPPPQPAHGAKYLPCVLLADDNADMREYVERLLSEQYEVTAVGDGEAALKCAREQRPDLILSDAMMPRMDGFELLRQLRDDQNLKSIPLILLSARAGEESRVEGLAAGADDYLVKPFSARELLARIGANISMAKIRREAAEQERALKNEAELERNQIRELFMHTNRELEERNADILRQAEQVRELSWRLLRTQDEERRHIARELHDSAGQTLAVLGMNLGMIVQAAEQTAPEIAESARETQELVQQLTKEIRTTSYLLHPPLLDENGLPAALSWYVRGLTERSGLDIAFNISEEFGRLPRDMELVVFRLVQECLTNIHRHSGSQSAAIQISRDPDRVLVEIRDQGKGISSEKLAEIQSKGSGVGIRGMRERLRQFQGELIIESNSNGTTVWSRSRLPKAWEVPTLQKPSKLRFPIISMFKPEFPVLTGVGKNREFRGVFLRGVAFFVLLNLTFDFVFGVIDGFADVFTCRLAFSDAASLWASCTSCAACLTSPIPARMTVCTPRRRRMSASGSASSSIRSATLPSATVPIEGRRRTPAAAPVAA